MSSPGVVSPSSSCAKASLATLAALAAGLCSEPGIGLEVHEVGWAFDADRRVILVDRSDLETRDLAYCAGIIAHEVGHVRISRYHLAAPTFPSASFWALLLNLLEDARVNEHMAQLFAGVGPWLAAAYAAPAQEPSSVAPQVLGYLQMGLREICARWTGVNDTDVVASARVLAALEATREARRLYGAVTLPERSDAEDPSLLLRYRALVGPRLRSQTSFVCPSLDEAAVRVRAFAALALAERDILPAVRALWDDDVRALAATIDAHPLERAALASGDESCVARMMAFTVWDAPANGLRSEESLALATTVLDQFFAGLMPSPARSPLPVRRVVAAGGRPSRLVFTAAASPAPRPMPSTTAAYEQIRASIAAQINALCATLEATLPLRQRRQIHGGHRSGARLDLRVARDLDRDPRLIDRAWRRSTTPMRRDAAVGLLIDLSGSMSGAKAGAALAAATLFVEALEALEIPHRVDGFQDVIVPLLPMARRRVAQQRARLLDITLEIEGTRPSGNNRPAYNDDGPCLAEACVRLREEPTHDAVLFVLSDGLPDGYRSSRADLERVIVQERRQGVRLVGLGVGDDTGHVAELYPDSAANVPVAELSATLGRLLARVLAR